MAGFQIEGLSEFMQKLDGISEKVGSAMGDAVRKGGKIVEEDLQRAIPQAADRGYATGALEKSIRAGGVKDTGDGKEVTVSPRGYVSHNGSKVRNQDKMYYLEHGTSRQAARPFMDRTIHGSEPKVVKVMEDEIGKAIGDTS